MRRYYPRSFLKLLVIGFTLVALPLILALINTAVSVDQLASRSQQTVYQAVQATQSTRRLAELITTMERAARQMVILGDRSLLDAYGVAREQLTRTAQQFERLPFDVELSDHAPGTLLVAAGFDVDPQALAAMLERGKPEGDLILFRLTLENK